jgi:hypothetical protein
VFLSTDNAETWTAANDGLTNPFVWAVAASGKNVFAGTNGGGIFRSTDNGDTWEGVNEGLTNARVWDLAACAGPNGPLVFAATDGGVFRSADSGDRWAAVNSGLSGRTVWALAKVPAPDGSGVPLFAGTAGEGVFRSTDFGDTWIPADNGPANPDVRSLAGRPAEGRVPMRVFAGTAGSGVFLSTDAGANWTPAHAGLENGDVRALAVVGDNLFAGSEAGVWRRPMAELLSAVHEPGPAAPSGFTVSPNYPNPFNPGTEIRCALVARTRVTAAVYDLRGARIATLADGPADAGSHVLRWDGTDGHNRPAPSGVYLCRIRAGESLRTVRLALLK